MKWLRNYWRHWRFGQLIGEPTDDDEGRSFAKLREFVYIDQRSVQSLLASTDSGRVAAEQTARESNTNTSERNANAGAGTGPVNIGIGGRRISREGTETENVYSFDLIQSKFTRLYEDDDITPPISLEADSAYALQDDLVLADLTRGTVLELRGEIQLHPLYRVYKATKYIDDAAPEEDIAQEDTLQLIEGSLGEKIPIEIEVDGISIVGDNDEIHASSSGEHINVVALLDENDLWTEPIQTLASNKQFTVFCRVEQVRPNWYPMKLIRVLESISPDLADEYNMLLEGELQTAIDAFEASVDASSRVSGVDESMVREFVEFLAETATVSVDDNEVETIVKNAVASYSPGEVNVAIEQEIELLKTTHNEFTDVVAESALLEPSHELRSEYLRGQVEQPSQSTEREFMPHLEANVIGIYW